MRRILTACVASALASLGILLSSSGAAAADFSGTWAISGTLGDPVIVTATPNCTFQQDGDKISGTCKGPNATGSVDGMVDGSTITWNWHAVPITARGLGGVATFKGVLGADGTLSGTWTHSAVDGVAGKFSAQRQVQTQPSPATSPAPAM
jgi:hypothetical protein